MQTPCAIMVPNVRALHEGSKLVGSVVLGRQLGAGMQVSPFCQLKSCCREFPTNSLLQPLRALKATPIGNLSQITRSGVEVFKYRNQV